MTLEDRLAIARRAGLRLARTWKGLVEQDDALQEAALIALERPEAWWDKHTPSYLLQYIKSRVYARLIRKRWFIRRCTGGYNLGGSGRRGKKGPKAIQVEGKRTLERIREVPHMDSDGSEIPRDSYVQRAGLVHLGGW